jgi:uncharacterized membrane protein YhaH (DUF805 family)
VTSYQPQPYIPQAGAPPLEMPQYGISFGGAIARGFKKYTLFTGRASRSEFWWWYLFTNLVVLVLGFGGIILTSRDGRGTLGLLSVILFTVFALGIIVPTLALTVRRLHDAGYSGLFALLLLVPYLGSLIVMIFALLPSSPAGAKYDPIAAAPDPYSPYPPKPSATPDPYSPYPPQNPYPS